MGGTGCLFNTDVTFGNFTLPLNVSFCAFRVLSCAVSICHNRTKIRGSCCGFLLCIAVFPRLITKPVIHCISVRGRVRRERAATADFRCKIVHFARNVFGGVVLSAYTKTVIATLVNKSVAGLSSFNT